MMKQALEHENAAFRGKSAVAFTARNEAGSDSRRLTNRMPADFNPRPAYQPSGIPTSGTWKY